MIPANVSSALSLETQILANTNVLLSLIGAIIEKVKKVRAFQKECSSLANTCILISLSYLENKDTLCDLRSAKDYVKCLKDVYALTTQCMNWGVWHIGWEVTISKRIEKLALELDTCRKNFDTELLIRVNNTSSTIKTSLVALQADLHAIRVDGVQLAERQEFFVHRNEIETEMLQRSKERDSIIPQSSPPIPLVDLSDPRLSICQTDPTRGRYGDCDIVLQEIKSTNHERPRCIRIYQQIGDIANVQKFYGVASVDGKQYGLMQDLSQHVSLAQSCQNGTLSTWSFLQKLRFAYDLCSTITALHASRLLLKSLADTNVYIVQSGEFERPLLTDLSQARDIWEVSAGRAYDLRFQSPETGRMGIHTRASDIWSLGVMFNQIFTAKFPYGVQAQEVYSSNGHGALNKINRAEVISAESFISDDMLIVFRTIKRCLTSVPALRPTAATIAQELFDCLSDEATKLELGINISVEASSPDQTMKIAASVEDILDAIEERKKHLGSIKIDEALKSGGRGLEPHRVFSVQDLESMKPETDARISYAVGSAYLWQLVKESGLQSNDESHARSVYNALPHLHRSEQLGYSEATEALYRAYRIMHLHYHNITKLQDD